MINGLIGQWIEEARQHYQHVLAVASAVKGMFPMAEIIRMAVVAIVTSVATSQVTIARLDERITALHQMRAETIARRNEDIAEMKRQDAALRVKLDALAADVAVIKARMK